MNFRSFTVFSAVAMMALGGCVIVGNGGTGGGGGSAGGGGEAGTGGSAGGIGVGGAGGAGGGPACDTPIDGKCYTCSELTTFVTCAGFDACTDSTAFITEYKACVCEMSCAAECKDSINCGGVTDPSQTCLDCIKGAVACEGAVSACNNN